MSSTQLRTHDCGALRLSDKGIRVTLCGWVREIRDKGPLLWVDLGDCYGVTQVILEKGVVSAALFATARSLGRSYVLRVSGVVVERSAKNGLMATGEIEVVPAALSVLNGSATPPFLLGEEADAGEALRMRYRYLDLRRRPLQDKLRLRHKVMRVVRNYLDGHGFMELETPLLIKSTPEGARDFVVPARNQPGHYYALPQSPQLFKQLLMVAGMDRYYQLAKCFRDEDLRSDRQPEFTQIDCELSFVGEEDILVLFELLLKRVFKDVLGVQLPTFPRMTYETAIREYGTDAPDLRWGMPFVEFTEVTKGYGFPLFESAELVAGIRVSGRADWPRKQLDGLRDFLREHYGAVGLVYVKHMAAGVLQASVGKFYGSDQLATWCSLAGVEPGDLLLLVGGPSGVVRGALAALRKVVVQRAEVVPSMAYAPVWVTNFPLFTTGSEGGLEAVHHPFTAPQEGDLHLLGTNPTTVRSRAYDIVVNGVELGGGSIRIHEADLQGRVLRMLGLDEKTIGEHFGFLLRALGFGAPPHGGIALGLDRLCLMLGGGASIRDYIPFPKNNQGRDTMIDAPGLLEL